MFLFGGGLLLVSMLAWRGFYLVDRNSLIPWICRLQSPETLASIYWLELCVLTLTVLSLVNGIVGFVRICFCGTKTSRKLDKS
jgi:hypothetical protein